MRPGLSRCRTPPSQRCSPSRSPSLQQLGKRPREGDEDADGLQPAMSDDVTRKEEDSSEPTRLQAFWESTGKLPHTLF